MMADQKIDVHAHFVPPVYRKALLDNGITNPDGMPGTPAWTVESHLDFMNATGIAKSILSISSPGTTITSDPSSNKKLARDTNEFAAEVKRNHQDRFGFFASLPFSAADAAVEEVKYALDELNADGFVVLSNTAGIYLGDPCLRPVLEELDKRKAVVFVHPTIACHQNHTHKNHSPAEQYSTSSPLATVYRAPLFEFFFDSARSILDLINSGTVLRFPNIRWIVSHCGNVLPSLLDRMFLVLRLGQKFTTARDGLEITEGQIKSVLRKQFWFDLAGDPVPNLVDALLKFTGKERLMFGSDVPWTPFEVTKTLVARIERDLPDCVGADAVGMIMKDTAQKLLSTKEL